MTEAIADAARHDLLLLEECAGRLRAIQADTGDASPEQRQEFFSEEIRRVLKEVPPGGRKQFLRDLLARFPIGGQVVEVRSVSTAAPSAPAPPPPKPETVDDLFAKYLQAASKAPEQQRQAMAKLLAEAGLGWVDPSVLVLEVSQEDCQKLGLPPGQQPRLKALVNLAVMLMEVFQKLDERAIATMRELSPKHALLKRPRDFRTAASQYLVNDAEPLEPQVRVIAGLLGTLLAAMLGCGREFGRQFVEKFAPSAIEDVVAGEGGGSFFGPNRKERCWDKYVDLARDYATADLVDRRLRENMAAFVEKKVPGSR